MAFVHSCGWQPPVVGKMLKAIGSGTGRFGALGVRFSGPDQKDLQGEYFTRATDFGPGNGDGSPVMIDHGRLLEDGLEAFANVILPAAQVELEPRGLFASVRLDLGDPLESAIAELIMQGCFRWSSGSVPQLANRNADGRITLWRIAEFSLTPTPAEPRLPRLRPL